MSHYNTVLHQLLGLIPRHQFDTLVEALDGDRYVKTFSTWNQLTALIYAQASGKESLRDIQNGFAVQPGRLYHLGLPATVPKSTLADANAQRDYHIYEQLFYKLLSRCRDLTPKHKFRFKNPLYSLDATVIDLCLAMYPWAKFRTRKGAIKLHYQFDHSGELPVFLTVTDGKRHEIAVAKEAFSISPDSIYCFDKAYIDYAWLRRITDERAFFVTRAKDNMAAQFLGQQERPKKKGVLFDFKIETTGFYAHQDYPYPLRLIGYWDTETGLYLEFLTNNFDLSAATIARIYKARWQIEIFFKWIKQNLKIKTFLGTSRNAVMTQVWVAMCYYLLLAYIKYQAHYRASLFYLHRIVKETLLERASLFDLLHLNPVRLTRLRCQDQQLCLQL
jgi:hypothetical protein